MADAKHVPDSERSSYARPILGKEKAASTGYHTETTKARAIKAEGQTIAGRSDEYGCAYT